jgi:hypothetical protein
MAGQSRKASHLMTQQRNQIKMIEEINATKSISSHDPPIHLHNVANQRHRCPVVITSRTSSSVDRGIIVIDKSTSTASETLRSRSSPRNIIRDSTHTADNLSTHRNRQFSTNRSESELLHYAFWQASADHHLYTIYFLSRTSIRILIAGFSIIESSAQTINFSFCQENAGFLGTQQTCYSPSYSGFHDFPDHTPLEVLSLFPHHRRFGHLLTFLCSAFFVQVYNIFFFVTKSMTSRSGFLGWAFKPTNPVGPKNAFNF